ncbi:MULTISPECIES: ATP-binding protein [unclassified Myxococcus]|uniref:ATP-binding protein n=1 Tax=unclassified Myxococcus TaxID=2648731 RepID=UPI00157B5178|nr:MULTISPECIES: ATP-binding protein [unclassified Myxococcus]NTX06064.1 GAF domain-containing protein [Myxococcus sp. CA040A]NTX09323.1 GAF domain-containing protein [Myxococcus sp. CA056]NTX37685.1 GAF domain-containing protein [Myxococcus sp. CA033]NTX53264.1 GAF domain-containing protein [Myxococcus sp. CA039A]
MSTRHYSEASLRAFIEPFANPVLAVVDGRVFAANDAYLALLGLPRERVEGRSIMDFVQPEDRSRLVERYRLLESGVPMEAATQLYQVPSADGVTREVALYASHLSLESGGRALLLNLLPMVDRPTELSVAERLVETSAGLVSAHSEDAVRRVALKGLEAAGFRVRLLRWDGMRLHALDGGPPPVDVYLGLEALSDGRPVFGGAERASPTHVYLPVGGPQVEVLRVEGPWVAPRHGSVLTLFAKVVGAALTDARVQADSTRSRWEVGAVAEMARFVARPIPPTPEDFLSRVSELLLAEAAVLHLTSGEEGPLELTAHFGLAESGVSPGAVDRLSRVMGASVPDALDGDLTTEAQAAVLREVSGGALGSGAAVRLARGGEICGVLQVLRAPDRPFDARDVRLLGTLSELLVTLLEQRRLRSESGRQLTETRLLLDLARTTSGVLETSSILDVASDFLVHLLDVSNCYIMLYDESAKVLRGAAASAAHRDFFRTVVLSLSSDSVAARAARERRPVAIEDVEASGGGFNPQLVQRFGEKALLALPLTSREELIGVVLVDDTRRTRGFSPQLVELAEATCGQLALSIANARLYESLWASYAELAATRAEMVKRERLAALGELSAIVAHEVRNPLGVIFNAVASLRRLLEPAGDAGMLLDILGEESDRLNRIVGDLLDYTRPRNPVLQHEDLGRVLQDSLEAARVQGGGTDRPVQIDSEVEPGLPPVPMDRRLIRQALVNVAVNAIQSMPQGGRVQVRARREAHGGREQLRIDVADQGLGIPAELLHRVFEPFFTTKAQGTGLGLAVVKRILEEHRGEIAVDSVPGRGTTFTFRLPLSQPPSFP